MSSGAVGGDLALTEKLMARGKSETIPADKDFYGWLVGNWDLDIEFYGMDVSKFGWKGEAHFWWILDGLAMQDTWTLPRWGEEKDPKKVKLSTGTSLRVWSAEKNAWLVTWLNPSSGVRDELVAQRVGNDLVQLGHHQNGAIIRWSFREITKDSFHWLGEVLEADGQTWKLEAAFLARRRTA
jgi:hypothetical protein